MSVMTPPSDSPNCTAIDSNGVRSSHAISMMRDTSSSVNGARAGAARKGRGGQADAVGRMIGVHGDKARCTADAQRPAY